MATKHWNQGCTDDHTHRTHVILSEIATRVVILAVNALCEGIDVRLSCPTRSSGLGQTADSLVPAHTGLTPEAGWEYSVGNGQNLIIAV